MLQFLTSKFSGVVTAVAKGRCWEELSREVSAVSGIVRTAAELKTKWVHVKSEAKGSVAAAKRSMRQTGGGEIMEGVTARGL